MSQSGFFYTADVPNTCGSGGIFIGGCKSIHD